MNVVARRMFLAVGALALIAVEANAQSFQFDSSRRIERDREGRVREYRELNARPNASYVLPFDGREQYRGSYFVRENRYYFVPRGSGNNRQQVEQVYPGGEFSHVEDLVMRLESLSNDLCLELHYNYSHNRGFRETYREAYQVLQIAQFIHEANHQNDRRGIQRRVKGMDELFHHIQEDVHAWTRHQHRAIGRTDMHTKMELVENTIHHLMYDVGVPHSGGHDEHGPRPGGRVEQAPQPR